MKNKLVIITLTAMLVFSMSISVYADVSFKVDSDTDYLTISGTLEEMAGKSVTIEILNPGKTVSDIASVTPHSFKDVFSSVAQLPLSSKGTFSYSYKLGDISGFYSVRVRPRGSDILYYDKAVKYVSDIFETNFINAYTADSAGTAERISLINSNSEIIGLDMSDFSTLSDGSSDKALLIGLIGKDFDSLVEFENTFNVSMLTFKLNKASKDSDLTSEFENNLEVISKLCSVAGLYDIYLDEAQSKSFVSSLCGNSYASTNAMIQDTGNKLILSSVKSLSIYSRLENILSMSKTWLGDEFSDYFALTDKSSVNSSVGGKSFATTELFCAAVHKAVGDANKQTGSTTAKPSVIPSAPIASGNTGGGSVSLPSSVPANPQDSGTPSQGGGTEKFNDISDVAWAQDAINALSEKGIINGTGDNKFEPNRNITREEFVKIIVSALFTPDESTVINFEDVTSSDWSSKYIATAVKLGIAKGVSQTSFAPKQYITRQDMAVMIYNAANVCGLALSEGKALEFSDSHMVTSYATKALEVLCDSGIISGYGDGRLAPLENATRAQCAKLIYNLIQSKGGEL